MRFLNISTTIKTLVFQVICFFLLFATISTTASANKNEEVYVTSESAIAYNLDSKEFMYEKNVNEVILVDNLSLLVVISILLDDLKDGKINLTDRISVTENAWTAKGPSMFLEPIHEPTIEDILNGLVVVSANDASVALSEFYSSNKEDLLTRVNEKIKILEMENTNISSLNGETPNTSTSLDLLKLSLHIMNDHKDFLDYFTKREFKYHPENRKNPYEFINHNSFLMNNEQITGLKSGWGNGYHLITTANIGGINTMLITLNDPSITERDKSNKVLLDYVRDFYVKINVAQKGETYTELYVYKSDTNGPDKVTYSDDLNVVVKKGVTTKDLNYNYVGEEYIVGGKQAGEKIGTLYISYKGKDLGSVDIKTTKDYPKSNFISSLFDSIAIFFNYVLIEWISSFF